MYRICKCKLSAYFGTIDLVISYFRCLLILSLILSLYAYALHAFIIHQIFELQPNIIDKLVNCNSMRKNIEHLFIY